MPPEKISDESELIRRFQNGDEEAFRLLIEHNEEVLCGLLHYTPEQVHQLREERVI